jgi:pimeloyl-ACP methyl ester carboxylesterase
VPPRMGELPVPEGGSAFEVDAQGHSIRGLVWGGSQSTVYLVHGWGGRGTQLGAVVGPLAEAGHRVVMFDMPAHGDSEHGPAGPRHTHGVEFAKALDAVFCRFGPAEAVVAHSMGTISTYLALRFGWLGTERLVFLAPMVEAESLFDQFQRALGFGPRVRRSFDRAVDEFIGVPLVEFDARVQARHVEPVPTLVISDRDDRQAAYAGVADFAKTIGAPLVTTEGLGHRKILRDPDVVERVVDFVSGGSGAGSRLDEPA